MIQKVKEGTTKFSELYKVLKLPNHEALLEKKARLLPTANTENEVWTTSIFLSSLSAIKEYREILLTTIGINKIKNRNTNLHVFTEMTDKKTGDRPDGLIVLTSGKSKPIIEWISFVESKVQNHPIKSTQIEKYIDFGKKTGINSLISISNQLVTNPTESPITTRKKKFHLYHWSWTYLKVTACRLLRTNSIEDEDHIYMLSELIRFFNAHKNLWNFKDMGGKVWKDLSSKIGKYKADQKIDLET